MTFFIQLNVKLYLTEGINGKRLWWVGSTILITACNELDFADSLFLGTPCCVVPSAREGIVPVRQDGTLTRESRPGNHQTPLWNMARY